MYTILANNDNTLTASVRERIMQRSKLVDNLHFLVDPIYKDIDMTDFTVTLEYILPISKQYMTETLVMSEDLYNGKLEYKLPFDTILTKEPGDIELQLTFTKVELQEDGTSIQYVRKTSTTTITIVPISAWSDIIPDNALNDLDQKIIKIETLIKELSDIQDLLATGKADNLVLDTVDKMLYLTSEGNQIGDRVSLETLGNEITVSSPNGLVEMLI